MTVKLTNPPANIDNELRRCIQLIIESIKSLDTRGTVLTQQATKLQTVINTGGGSSGGGTGPAVGLSSVAALALDATAAAGTAGLASRADHVHPFPSAADLGIATAPPFVQTADQVIGDTTEATTLFGAGEGSLSFAANYFEVGTSLLVSLAALIDTAAIPGDVTVRLKLGGATVATAVLTDLLADSSGEPFTIEAALTCRADGSGGTMIAAGEISYSATTGMTTARLDNAVGFGIDTTVVNALDIEFEWATADADNEVKSFYGLVALPVMAGGSVSGGQVDSVVAGTGVEIDSTDPVNPEVALSGATITSLEKADAAEPGFGKGDLIAGTNVSFTGSGVGRLVGGASLTIHATGGGGGGDVDSVVAGAGIDVDASDPANPVVHLDDDAIDALGLAESALQPGDVVNEVGAYFFSYPNGSLIVADDAPVVTRRVGRGGTIVGISIVTEGGTGSCELDIWLVDPASHYPPVVGDSIVSGGNYPKIVAGTYMVDSTLTGISTTVLAGQVFAFKVRSCSVFTDLTIQLEIE